MTRLDWWLFGNGHGTASPFFDDVFYWLHDCNYARDRKGYHSRWYRYIGGFGAQLDSFEWRRPPAGTRRRLFGYDFVIFSTSRRWLRVRCSWSAVGVDSIDDIRRLRDKLQRWGHGE